MDSQEAKPTHVALSREGSLDESLPLYEEFQHSDQPYDALPSEKASPSEVADFLVHILMRRNVFPIENARRVAAKWTKGSGEELRSYPPAMYFEIFDKEDGWVTYREVHLALLREKSKGIWQRFGVWIMLATSLCLEIIAVPIAIFGKEHNILNLVATLASGLNGMVCIGIWLAALITWTTTSKSEIESTLREALNKSGSNGSG